MTTYIEAVDAIKGRLTAQWLADAATAIGSITPELQYEGSDKADRVTGTNNVPWARATIMHEGSTRRTVGKNAKFTRTGKVTVQCFYPNSSPIAQQHSRALAEVAQTAFENKRASSVTFRDTAVLEKGTEAAWYRCDCVTEFQWDSHRGPQT